MISIALAANFVAVLTWLAISRSRIHRRIRIEIFVLVLVVLGLGFYSIAMRFEAGLGVATNLSDVVPWGLWIAFDLCGVALAAGGFVLAATVHIFKVKRFEPILRPVILTSFISYSLVAAILVLDLGRPYRFWHPLVMWQPRSVMFEITLCITLYTTVLMLELSPIIFEKLGWHKAASIIHDSSIPLVIVGVILSTLHQSSFGSLFLIVPEKLSTLWYTPILPLLFLISAIAVGIAVVIVESYLCLTLLNKQLPKRLLIELGYLTSKVLWLYFAVKLSDAVARRIWNDLLINPWLSFSLLTEVVVGVVVPALWLGLKKKGNASAKLILGSTMVIMGTVLNRLNVCWFGLMPYTAPTVYFPSWMEAFSTLTLVLMGIIVFVVVSRFLPIFPEKNVLD